MFNRKFVLLFLILLAIPATLYAQEATEEAPEGWIVYAGHVTDIEDEFVAIGLAGDSVTVYICDGRADEGTVTIAEWFFGTIEDGVVDLTSSAGHRVEATVGETTAEGQFTMADGTIKAFELELTEGQGGLFRSEFAFGDDEFVAGWLVFANGEVRGAVRNIETGKLTPASFVGQNVGL